MAKNTSVLLGDHFEDFINNSLAKGRFKNTSEIVRAGLRLLEEEENKSALLRSAIQKGIDSGIVEDFDPKKHLEILKAKRKANG